MFRNSQQFPKRYIFVRLLLTCLIIGIITVSLAAILKSLSSTQTPADRPPIHGTHVPREVLAFYYGWYASPQVSGVWYHWGNVDLVHQHIGTSAHYPVGGPYDSHDPQVVARQCELARQAGITGFIVSWWGPGSFEDRGIPILLAAAQRVGLKVTIYDEIATHTKSPASATTVEHDLLYILHRYAQHPAWLRVGKTPVIFIYERVIQAIPWNEWPSIVAHVKTSFPGGAAFIADKLSSQAAQVFDGLHTYSFPWALHGLSITQVQHWAATNYSQWVKLAGPDHISCVTVMPGYDDRSQSNRPLPRPIVDRDGGSIYRMQWQQAIATHPTWILITSWNEWHEGTEIEPSTEFGETALLITQAYAHQFLEFRSQTKE
jgi:hypothetical protein